VRPRDNRYFDPETIVILRGVLETAWITLPDRLKRDTPRSVLAERILKAAAKEERDPVRLRASALVDMA
jgi:hypothetical protein